MKKRIKKLVSLLVVSSMCFSLLATTAFAETGSGVQNEGEVSRIYGDSRYETSYTVADMLKETLGIDKFSTVIVANGENFPDALAGSYLASKMDAPILMVNGKSEKNIAQLQAYISQSLVDDGKIYILGGTAAVSEAVEDVLDDTYEVKRLAGSDRYATNLLILNEAGVSDEDILVCTGNTYADSLAASATGMPILLVHPDAGLSAEQTAFLTATKGNDIYIVGGKSAVSEAYDVVLRLYDEDDVERVAGANRYETSTQIAERFFENPTQVITAYAWDFPDGLCGGPLAFALKAPLVLTGANIKANPNSAKEEASAESVVKYMTSNGITSGLILGGTAVVSSNTVKIIFGVDEESATDETVYKLTVTQHDPEASAAGTFLNNWAAEVEEASAGRIDVVIYHGGSVAGPKDSIDAVLNGTVDIAWGRQLYYAGQFPVTEVFALPCLDIDSAVEGSEALWNFYNTTDYMEKEYEAFHVLNLHVGSQSPIMTVDKNLETVSNAKGMAIRIYAGPSVTFVTELGASAEGCADSDVYSNLDKGVYDGCITDWETIERFKLYESVNYLLDENVGVTTYFLLMNPDSYARLPEDLQAILDEVSADAGKYAVSWDEAEDTVKMREEVTHKLYNLSETERANLETAVKATVENWITYNVNGQEIYDAAMKCIADAKK